VASRARAWTTSLACRLTNSTLELENRLRNRERHEEIIQPNSDKLLRVARKASTVNLESVSKSKLSSCISLNHCKAECSPRASPTSTETVDGYVIDYLARRKAPSESRTQMPIPVRLWWEEKAASILHLYLPGIGGCHDIRLCWCGVKAPVFAAIACWECEGAARTSGAFASCQSVIMFLARSTTTTLVYVILSQTLILRCFHRLEITVDRSWANSADNFSKREKTASVAEAVWARACCTEPQSPIICHTCIAKGQSKKTCKRSSWVEAQLAQLVGQTTPLSNKRTRVGKQSRHMRQSKFLTFGGTLRFQIPD